jgi:1-acyl-sn-glycerol-3-phosphate acyltransferase
MVSIVGFPWTWITGNVEALYRMGIWVARTGLRLAGIRSDVRGLENIPARSCILMSNHISNLDPCVVIPPIPQRVSILIKKGLMRVPLLGPAMRLAKFVPIDREQRESAISSLDDAKAVLQSGLSIAIFAEGTRSRDGKLLPFKKGPFYLAYEAGVPVVPVSVSGTETMMRKGSSRIFPGTATVIYHPALDPHQFNTREDLMEAVRSAVASGLPAWMTT